MDNVRALPGQVPEQLGADLRVRTADVSSMLVALGVDLTHPLAPSMIIGAFDVLAAVEIGTTLPSGVNFAAAIRSFHTVAKPQPAAVRDVQRLVLQSLLAVLDDLDAARAQMISEALSSHSIH